jgi:signal transduction histidine kinase
VEALGRDEPPPDGVLNAPREMAVLAEALDRARISLGDMRQQLVDAERLTTIGEMAAQLAHNLRNPLASIRASAQITERRAGDNAYTQERMQEIVASVDRLEHWISGLMEIARNQPTPTREADLAPLLRRVAEAVQPDLAAKELYLELKLPDGELACGHNPDTVEHALVAMINNAIEASPVGGTITIRAERAKTANGSPVCRLEVRDAGPGIGEAEADRIFDFSYSTKQHGMGLGLALARQGLERQGGSVHAWNHEEGGAVLVIDLPMTTAPADAAGQSVGS